jgi:hypothetical protein
VRFAGAGFGAKDAARWGPSGCHCIVATSTAGADGYTLPYLQLRNALNVAGFGEVGGNLIGRAPGARARLLLAGISLATTQQDQDSPVTMTPNVCFAECPRSASAGISLATTQQDQDSPVTMTPNVCFAGCPRSASFGWLLGVRDRGRSATGRRSGGLLLYQRPTGQTSAECQHGGEHCNGGNAGDAVLHLGGARVQQSRT